MDDWYEKQVKMNGEMLTEIREIQLKRFGIQTNGYSLSAMSTILEAANLTGEKIKTVTGHSEASDAFKATHGDIVMVWNPDAVFEGEEEGQRGLANCETK